MKPLVPADFLVPDRLELDHFLLRPLRVGDVDSDLEAVRSSLDRLRGLFGPRSTWPAADLSREQELIDLGWHHKEFQMRSSFAYTVLSPDAAQCVGCAYIFATEIPGYDAEAYCWVRTSHASLDSLLFEALKAWLVRAWPFARVAFPGRELPWSERVRGIEL